MSGVVVAVVVLAVVVVAVVMAATRGSSAAAAIGRELVASVPSTPDTVRLLERWRDRAARWRAVVAIPVVVAVLVSSIALRASIDLGIGDHPAWSDPLLLGLLGVFLGAIAAELHHLRAPRGGRRRGAELVPRDLHDHLPSGSRRRLVALAVASGVAALLTVVVSGRVPGLGLVGLAVAGSVPVVQRGIVLRARPPLDPALRAADDAVRRLAVRSVDEAGAGAVVLLAAWQLGPVLEVAATSTTVEVVVAVARIVALVVAIVWWRRSSPARLLPDVPGMLPRPAGVAHLP